MQLYLRLLRFVRPYARRVAFALGAMLLFGLTSALPFPLIKPMLDEIFVHNDLTSLVRIPLLLVAVFLVKGFANFWATYLMRHVGQSVVADLRRALFDHMLCLPMTFFHRASSGDLLSRVLFDTTQVETALSRQIGEILKEALSLASLAVILFVLSWRYALASVVVVPLVLGPLSSLRGRIRHASRTGQEQIGSLSSTLQEALSGILAVKSFRMEDYERRKFHEANDGYRRSSLVAARYESLSTPAIEICAALMIAGTVYFGGLEVLHGRTTTGTFFAFMGALFALYKPLSSLNRAGTHLQQALAAASRLFEILDAPPEPLGGDLEVPSGPLEVRYRGVGFSYGGERVLSDVDLVLRPGEVVAVVGPSGAGKTTLAHLLPRLYDPTEGVIEINGVPLPRFRLESLRGKVGLVSQDTILFRDSVRENLRHGRDEVSDRRLWDALEAAAASGFVAALPEGLDAALGDRGSTLSGGQRQRLTLARALVKDPPVLVLDEATSALDPDSEKLVQAALLHLLDGRTVLIVAHRLSTVQNADRIVVLEAGRIVETGTHRELLDRGGAYARLYQAAGEADGGRLPNGTPPSEPSGSDRPGSESR
jgi:ATP-binding cassette, subfamily B, bacterial MsbA